MISKKILLAEDEPQNSLLLKRIISKSGNTVSAVENGAEIMQKLETEDFDMVILDLSMPVMDGIETTKMIRNHNSESVKNLPILIVSGNEESFLKNLCKDINANDFICKPFDLQDVLFKIETYLQ